MNCTDSIQGKERLNTLTSAEISYYNTALQVGKQPSWPEKQLAPVFSKLRSLQELHPALHRSATLLLTATDDKPRKKVFCESTTNEGRRMEQMQTNLSSRWEGFWTLLPGQSWLLKSSLGTQALMLWKKFRLSFQVHKVVHCNRYRLVCLEIERMDKHWQFLSYQLLL